MKKSYTILLIILLLVVGIWFAKRSPRNPSPSHDEANASQPAEALSSLAASQASVETNAVKAQIAPDTHDKPPIHDKGAQMRQGLSLLNDAPIVFYGKVEDQFGNPLGDVAINFSVQVYNGRESGIKNGVVSSDANGFFTISGYNGERLSFMPKKMGYVVASLNCGGIYSSMWPEEQRVHPDVNNPVAIKMWKLQGAESLVNLQKTYKLQYTTEPIYFDLTAQMIVSNGGDLKITVDRPNGVISEQHPQDWGVKFEVVDGGFIEVSDKEWGITYLAPETGYQPIVVFQKNNGVGGLDKTLFLKSRNGQVYSKVGLAFGINQKSDDFISVRFSGFANTNGSRNWEATVSQ